MQFHLKLLVLISHPGITHIQWQYRTFSRIKCANPCLRLPCFLCFTNIWGKKQTSNKFQAVSMLTLIFLLGNSSFAHWQWKCIQNDFQCIALQVVYTITHSTNAELSCRETKERTRKAMEATTLHQLFKAEHSFLTEKEYFFPKELPVQ